MVDEFALQFRRAWQPGWQLTIDETMVWWTGLSDAHLTYLPRKPTPLGFQMKTLCDSQSHIMLNMEVCEGKDIDRWKPPAPQLGVTAATTIRVTEPFHGKGCMLIADSWFGSVKTAAELLKRGVFSIMNVKVATKGFPKHKLKAYQLERGQSKHLRTHVLVNNEPRPIFASIHMDS